MPNASLNVLTEQRDLFPFFQKTSLSEAIKSNLGKRVHRFGLSSLVSIFNSKLNFISTLISIDLKHMTFVTFSRRNVTNRDVGSISNLGGEHDTSRARFSLRRSGQVLNMKRALLCLLNNLGGGTCPLCPPGSYFSV